VEVRSKATSPKQGQKSPAWQTLPLTSYFCTGRRGVVSWSGGHAQLCHRAISSLTVVP
jgi:hypothetical protein